MSRHYRDLPCHVAFIAHVRRDEDSDGEVTYGPALTPAVADNLLGFVDLVCWCRAIPRGDGDDVDYVGTFRPVKKHVGKDRFGLLPARLINPTFDRILKYINGEYSREALRAAEQGDMRPDLDLEQWHYIQRISASKPTTVKKEN